MDVNTAMRAWEFDRYGVYGKPKRRPKLSSGDASPLTYQGTRAWRDEKDYARKWFSRPFLTNGPKGNHMLPIKR